MNNSVDPSETAQNTSTMANLKKYLKTKRNLTSTLRITTPCVAGAWMIWMRLRSSIWEFFNVQASHTTDYLQPVREMPGAE
jgi:hypothetical protein